MIENENNENLYFQISQLQKDGKSVGALKKVIEQEIWHKAEKKLSPIRPRWEIINQDEGILFAQKEMPNGSVKHMDILEGEKEFTGEKYKDIIIYKVGHEENNVIVRTKKEPLDGKNK